MNEYTELAIQQQRKYFNQIGDLTESMRFTTTSMQQLGRMGIRPSAAAMDEMAGTFRVLNKIAGVTSDQFSAMMETTMSDLDVQTRLRVAKEGERRAIIQGINRQIEMNVAMGLTAEQAQAAALAMGKIAGGGAKERFKRAAQMQMAFAAMGVEGGSRAAELVRKGQARMSPAEREELEKLTTRFTEASTAAKGGSIPQEFLRDTLLDKTGLNQYFGEDSPLNKQLGEGLAANKGVLEQIHESIREGMNIWEKGLAISQGIGNFIVNGALGKLIISAVQLIGAYVIGRGALSMAGRFATGGRIATAAAQTGGVLTSGKAAASSILKKLGVVGAVADVGFGINELAQGGRQSSMPAGWNMLSPMSWGMWGGEKVNQGVDFVTGGNSIGSMLYDLFNDDEVGLSKTTEQMLEPTKRTAEATERQLSQSELTNELLKMLVEVNSGAISKTDAQNRITNLQSGMVPSTAR